MIAAVIFALTTILLILVLALIFSKDFRQDVIKGGSENEAEYKSFKVRGALFWTVYALTAIGTIFLVFTSSPEQSECKPVITSVNNNDWIAFDLVEAQPVDITYGCENNPWVKAAHAIPLNLELTLNSQLKVMSSKSSYQLGELDRQSLKNLNLTNDFEKITHIEIFYDITLSPFKATRSNNSFYDWNDYANLPFKVTVEWDSERSTHVLIQGKNENEPMKEIYQSLNSKWVEFIPVQGGLYIVRLRSASMMDNPPPHANIQIIKLSGDIKTP
jgi:hypothetical protein